MAKKLSIVGFEYFPKKTFLVYFSLNDSFYNQKPIKIKIFDPFSKFIYWEDFLIFSQPDSLWVGPAFQLLLSNQINFEFYHENKLIEYDHVCFSDQIDLKSVERFKFLSYYLKNNISLAAFIDVFIWELYNKTNYEINSNDIVVDIGSNIGMFIHYALEKKVKSVICCEPNPKAFDILKQQFDGNRQVFLNNYAISRKNETLNLIYPVQNDVSGKEFISSNEHIYWHHRDHRSQKVNGISFLDFIKLNNLTKIDFLKLDCEGGEHDIFIPENAEYFKTNVKKIAMETHGAIDKILNFLDENNFTYEYKQFNSILNMIWAKNKNLI